MIDIDGALTTPWKPLPGAVRPLERLRAVGLLTNTTSRTRASIAETLAAADFPVTLEGHPDRPVRHRRSLPQRPLRGARLVAMHLSRCWRTDQGLQLHGGGFLFGMEQSSGRRAEVVGKPAAAFFAAALAML